jgi:methionine aminotransferase
MKPLDSKLPTVGTTIFTVMSQLAEQHRAVNLSQGFPDFLPPAELLERVEHALRGRYHQYAPMPGSVPLRTAIAAKLAALYGVTVDPVAAVTVTSGATEAIFDAIQAVVRRDDEVIVFDPCYDSYEPSITLAGGRAICR